MKAGVSSIVFWKNSLALRKASIEFRLTAQRLESTMAMYIESKDSLLGCTVSAMMYIRVFGDATSCIANLNVRKDL